MYKIVCLLIKYVKLAILSELLSAVKISLADARLRIDESASDIQKNYWAGKICAYQDMSTMIAARLKTIKGVTDDTRSNQ